MITPLTIIWIFPISYGVSWIWTECLFLTLDLVNLFFYFLFIFFLLQFFDQLLEGSLRSIHLFQMTFIYFFKGSYFRFVFHSLGFWSISMASRLAVFISFHFFFWFFSLVVVVVVVWFSICVVRSAFLCMSILGSTPLHFGFFICLRSVVRCVMFPLSVSLCATSLFAGITTGFISLLDQDGSLYLRELIVDFFSSSINCLVL